MSTVNQVSINTIADEWTSPQTGVMVELTPISDGIMNGTDATTGPICVAATGNGLYIICERPYGTRTYAIDLMGDEPIIKAVL